MLLNDFNRLELPLSDILYRYFIGIIRRYNMSNKPEGFILSDFVDLEQRVAMIAVVIELSETTTKTFKEICYETGLSWNCVRG